DHKDLVGTARLRGARFHRRADGRVSERLEIRTRLGIGEHDVAQRRPVEMPIGGEDLRTEALDQALERRLARLDHIARDLIAVENRYPERTEELRGGRLPTGDSAGEAYPVCTRAQCAHGSAAARPR